MTTPMNVVALAGIPGISVIAITHGLGALPATPPTPPINPLLTLGGAEDEEWWEKRKAATDAKFDESFGYFTAADSGVGSGGGGGGGGTTWEYDADPYPKGGQVTISDFTSKLVALVRDEARERQFQAIIGKLWRQDQEKPRKLVQVTITVKGVSYSLWRVL